METGGLISQDPFKITPNDELSARIELAGKTNQEIVEMYALVKKRADIYKDLSEKDPLTKIYNRRGVVNEFKRVAGILESRPSQERSKGREESFLFSVIMFDLVGFKKIDDASPTEADATLVKVGDTLQNLARRGTEVGGRWGGDEFALVQANSTENSAMETAVRIQQGLSILGLQVSVAVGLFDDNVDRLDERLNEVHEGLAEAKASRPKDETGRSLGIGIVVTNREQ